MRPTYLTLNVLAAAVVVIVTTVSLAAVGLAACLAERRWERKYLHTEAAAYADGLSTSLSQPGLDPARVDQLIKSHMDAPDVHAVVVQSPDPAAPGDLATHILTRDDRGNVVVSGQLPAAVNGLVVLERPLRGPPGGGTPGSVRVYMTPHAIRSDLRITLPQFVWVVLGLDALLSASLYALLWWTVLRPLRDIERYARAVRAEPQRLRAPPAGPPIHRYACRELNDLQDSIVHMVRLLHSHLHSQLVALRRNETMLSTILEAVPYCLWWKDRGGVFLGCNQAFAEAAGRRDASEIIGKTDFDLPWPREEAEAYCVADREVLATNQPRRHIVEPITHAGGPRRWAATTKVPLLDADGAPYAVLGVAEDITERKEAEDALRREKAFNEAVLNGVPGFLCLYDDRGTLVQWNDKIVEALHAFGYADDGSGQWHVFDWFPDDEKGRADAAVREVMARGHAELEADLITKDGVRIPHFHTGVRLMIEGKAYLLTISIDISQRKRAEEQLRSALHQAESASRAKDRFLAAASHELRTPLTPVLLLASSLEADPRLPPDARQDLAVVREHIEVEKRLISDLLDFTAIHAGKLHMNAVLTDVHDVLHAAVRTCQESLGRKGIRLDVRLDALHHHGSGDPDRLRQVFWNLLQNACKFTPEQGTIFVRTADDGGSALRVEVSDTGMGMDAETLRRLFRPFEQGPRDRHMQHYGGLGLGLAISKTLVEAHGGSISAASEGPGLGSTFVVRLPMTPAVPGHPGHVTHAVQVGMARLNLLLVEDHPPTLKTLQRLLAADGHEVTATATIAEAIGAADRARFDLVLSDIGLPDGSGYDLMPALRDRYGLPGIALSGFGADSDLDASRKAGFLAHLTKPVTVEALRDALSRFAASKPRPQTTEGERHAQFKE